MDLNQRPPWSNSALGRLGKALRDDVTPPDNCPSYNDVMLWHSDLAAEVHEQIENGSWVVAAEMQATAARRIGAELLVSSRPKTVDTLVEKLRRRPNQQLNTVQDLAGVRIDADMVLGEQTELAREIAAHFGADEIEDIHDLRSGEHAGYRGVHVWLKLPAGRVEVQIRTLFQNRGQERLMSDFDQKDVDDPTPCTQGHKRCVRTDYAVMGGVKQITWQRGPTCWVGGCPAHDEYLASERPA